MASCDPAGSVDNPLVCADNLLGRSQSPGPEEWFALGAILERSALRDLIQQLPHCPPLGSRLRYILEVAARATAYRVNPALRKEAAHYLETTLAEIDSLGWWPLAQEQLRDFRALVAQRLRDRASTPSLLAPTEPPTILSYGSKTYGVGDRRVVVLDSEDAVFTAFLDHPVMGYTDLVRRAGDKAPKTLRRLRMKYERLFAPAIKMAQQKGLGGYEVRIRTA